LFDIRPGNGAGLFLQPRRPHGADEAVDQWRKRLRAWEKAKEHSVNIW